MTQDIAEASLEEIPTGQALVQLKDVGKSYGNITALKGISLKTRAKRLNPTQVTPRAPISE